MLNNRSSSAEVFVTDDCSTRRLGGLQPGGYGGFTVPLYSTIVSKSTAGATLKSDPVQPGVVQFMRTSRSCEPFQSSHGHQWSPSKLVTATIPPGTVGQSVAIVRPTLTCSGDEVVGTATPEGSSVTLPAWTHIQLRRPDNTCCLKGGYVQSNGTILWIG